VTYVVCIILGVQVHGVRIDVQGSQWLVYFHKKTVWVDSNKCLLEDK
jgi:hypothetical protein